MLFEDFSEKFWVSGGEKGEEKGRKRDGFGRAVCMVRKLHEKGFEKSAGSKSGKGFRLLREDILRRGSGERTV